MPPSPIVGWYLFWLGVAVGVTALAMTAYLAISPRWLRWLLLASGAFVASRYVTMALFATSPEPHALWALRRCWVATSVGLTFPAIVALDQLVRHPAMSPKKLLRWFSPFLACYALVLGFGRFELTADPLVGTSPRLVGGWLWVLAVVQGLFVIGVLALGALLIQKLTSRRIRIALFGLMGAYGYLGLDGLFLALDRWYFRPFLFSEILALIAIWFALETARQSSV